MQELRKGKFIRLNSSSKDVLRTIAELQLPVESTATSTINMATNTNASMGVTLLPSATVEALLVDKRKLELVQPFKLALLKLASQVGAGPGCGLTTRQLHSMCIVTAPSLTNTEPQWNRPSYTRL
jgi:hypothetical protein